MRDSGRPADTVSVIGLGKLGAPLAACLASKGLTVIGVDVDAAKVQAVNEGRAPVFEPDLERLIRASAGRLKATSDIEAAVASSETTFIVVATPSQPDGSFSLKFVLATCESVGKALRAKDGFHLVVLTSTVMPGSTSGEVRAALENASGKLVGRDFGLCYSPEFIALGSVIRDFLNPDFVLIGESDARSGALLESLYKKVCQNTPAVARMNIINAEVAKLSVNTFITTKISFANMLARICEALPAANVDVVTSTLGLDTRIGGKYLKGAVSYGGPCFPRDNLALAALARRLSVPADLAQATDHFNRGQVSWLAGVVERSLPANGAAGVLGLTYKPQTDVVEQSFGLLLAQELAKRNVRVAAYDPEGARNSSRALGATVALCSSANECIAYSDVIVLATPWAEFAQIPATQWSRTASPRMVIDCWRALKHLDGAEGVRYLSLGVGAAAGQASPLGAGC